MVLSKHFLSTVGQLLNGVGVVVHSLLEDHVALKHQHGALLVLRRWEKKWTKKNQEESGEMNF